MFLGIIVGTTIEHYFLNDAFKRCCLMVKLGATKSYCFLMLLNFTRKVDKGFKDGGQAQW